MTDVLKLLSKSSQFTGEEREWKVWTFSFLEYLGTADPEMVKETKTAMKSKVQVILANMSPDEQRRLATLFSMLVQLWKKRALFLFLMTEELDGYEALHRSEIKAAKMLPGQNWAGLQRTLAFELADATANPQAMMQTIEKFELMIEQHEAESSTLMDDEVKTAVMLRGIPEKLKAAVYSNPAAFDTYD